MAKKREKINSKGILLSMILVLVAIIGTVSLDGGENKSAGPDSSGAGSAVSGAEAFVHFIDIGQGSATLVTAGDKSLLIDTGEKDYSYTLEAYINSCGISKLDYVVASHPHSDHIGGMAEVINSYEIGTFIMPELTEKNAPTTKVYETMLDALIEQEVNACYSEVGDVYTLCEGVSFEILGPCEQMNDLNNMSIIVKLTVNGVDFMVLGDAEEKELDSVFTAYPQTDYRSDVLVMGHHGSRTSIHDEFLAAVGAETAVISCGRDNSYGHPNQEALDYITENGLEVYRTDLDSDIVFRCIDDGYERVDF